MKKFKFFAAFFTIVSLLGLTGCSEEETELLNGGQGTDGSIQLNINYTIPGQEAKVFSATYVTADASSTSITITAENEDTGESLVMAFAGNKLNTAYTTTSLTYIDPAGNEYSALSPLTDLQTGAVKLTAINTAGKTITGVFSFIGYDADASTVEDGVPFYSGTFINVPYTGTLPEPTPATAFMKATVDGTVVDFAAASTQTVGTITTFVGTNTNPIYMLQLVFADNTAIAVGTFPIDMTNVSAQVTIGTSSYVGISGSVIITDITDNIVTGTFTFTGESGEGNIEVTAGSFKLPKQ